MTLEISQTSSQENWKTMEANQWNPKKVHFSRWTGKLETGLISYVISKVIKFFAASPVRAKAEAIFSALEKSNQPIAVEQQSVFDYLNEKLSDASKQKFHHWWASHRVPDVSEETSDKPEPTTKAEIAKQAPKEARDLALHEAIIFGDEAECHRLIDSGIDLRATNECGQTPLHIAVEKNLESIASRLIETDTHSLQDVFGFTPLHMAVRFSSLNLAKSSPNCCVNSLRHCVLPFLDYSNLATGASKAQPPSRGWAELGELPTASTFLHLQILNIDVPPTTPKPLGIRS